MVIEPSIKIIDSFIDNSDVLFNVLSVGIQWDERMKARKTASFGVSYNYSGISYPKMEMHKELIPLCHLIEKEVGFYPNNCLLNYYLDGDSTMGYHSDSTDELQGDTGVAIISLGSERLISYKNKLNKNIVVNYLLKSGSLLYMNKAVQYDWLHAIPKNENEGGRISLTFRLMKVV